LRPEQADAGAHPAEPAAAPGVADADCCDTRSHVVSELVEEVWLMPET